LDNHTFITHVPLLKTYGDRSLEVSRSFFTNFKL